MMNVLHLELYCVKMKVLVCFIFFGLFGTIGFAQNQLDPFNQETSISQIDFSTKDILWADNSIRRFAVVTFKTVPVNRSVLDKEEFYFQPYYEDFNGPIYLFNKGCTILPIETAHLQADSTEKGWHKKVQALFLLSDLEQFQDSFTIVLEGYFGYANQSQMHTMSIKTKVRPSDINFMPFATQSNSSIPTNVATNEWFENYLKENPKDTRFHSWYFKDGRRRRCK